MLSVCTHPRRSAGVFGTFGWRMFNSAERAGASCTFYRSSPSRGARFLGRFAWTVQMERVRARLVMSAPREFSSRLPRIVMIDAALRENGGTRVLIDLAARWVRAGAPTEYFVMQKIAEEAPDLVALARDRVPVVYGCDTPGRLRNALPKVFMRFWRAARRADVVVCVSEDGMNLLVGAAVAKLLRKPFVVVIHAPVRKAADDWMPRRLHGAMFASHRSAAALVCVADGCIEDLIAVGVDRSRIHVIRNGIDVERIQRAAAAEIDPPLPARVERPLVVAVGRLCAQKGFDLLLRAHAQVVKQGLAHHLAVIGEGPDRPQLEALISELGIASSVWLLGFRPNPHAVVARSDLFCLSSRYEGYPLVLIEALATGTAIVSGNCVTGPADILADGAYGDLVEANSVDALAAGIARHLRDRSRLAAIAQKGPAHARSFDPEHAAAEYMQVFSRVGRPQTAAELAA